MQLTQPSGNLSRKPHGKSCDGDLFMQQAPGGRPPPTLLKSEDPILRQSQVWTPFQNPLHTRILQQNFMSNTDGEKIKTYFWHASEPQPGKNCAVLVQVDEKYRWTATKCSERHSVICTQCKQLNFYHDCY